MSSQNTLEVARVKTTVDLEAKSVTVFVPGTTLSMAVEFADLNPSVTLAAIAQGVVKKVTDGAAIAKDPTTGKSATIEEKWAAMLAIRDRIVGPNGQWNVDAKRAAQLRKEAQEAQEWQATLAALCAIKGTTLDSAEGGKLAAWANAKGREAVVALRNAKPEFMAEYVKALAALKASATSQGEEVDSLLDELDAL